MDILRCLKFLNYVFGAGVIGSSIYYYFLENKTVPLYIASAIIIAGPLEDYLISCVNNSPSISPQDKRIYTQVIDNITSLAFLILLGITASKAER